MRILLLLVDHGPFEELVNKLLPEIAGDSISLAIYWERLYRTDPARNGLELGLEDPVLTALFQLVVFEASIRDERVYDRVERGVGRRENKRPTTIPRQALIAARGATALGDLFKVRGNFPDPMKVLIGSINTRELVEHRHDAPYVSEVNYRLQHLLAMLLNWIEPRPEYAQLVPVGGLLDALAGISPDIDIELSDESAQSARKIVRLARDRSNYQYVTANTGGAVSVVLVIGGAHYPELTRLFSSSGIAVSVAHLVRESKTPNELQVRLFLEECISDFSGGAGKDEYSLFVD